MGDRKFKLIFKQTITSILDRLSVIYLFGNTRGAKLLAYDLSLVEGNKIFIIGLLAKKQKKKTTLLILSVI